MEYESGAIERPEDIEKNPAGVVKRWLLEWKLADKREDKWRKDAERAIKRYQAKDTKKHSFNILWSNTETLRPAIYNSVPKPDVRRRFKDADPIGKAVSEVLSRSLEYTIDTTGFDSQIKACVMDMLLPGRGVARVRYIPSLSQVGATPENHEESAEQHIEGEEAMEGSYEELAWEQAPIEHVQWDKFRFSQADEWSEVTWVGFEHRLTRDKLEEQFGEIGSLVPMDAVDDEDVNKEADESVKEAFKTAKVYEIWCKDSLTVYFIAPSYKEKPLLTVKDPLNLKDFFPVPKPLYHTADSTTLVPIPLFEYYKQQADELDNVTRRINYIVSGLKLRGVYDETITALADIMKGDDNDLLPSNGIMNLLERGGLEKAIWFMPIEQAANVLQVLQLQREAVKQVIYEITGISDILRGSTNANETATAQQIKANWGSQRVKDMQSNVAIFTRDLIRMQAEIIGEKFQPETLATMTGLKFPTQQDLMLAQQQGQEVPPDTPTWEQVIQILRDDKMRTFKVDIETDSTIAASIESDMAGLKDVLGAVAQLMQAFGPAVQVGAMPVEALKEMIMAVTRRARMGNAVEDALDKMKAPEQQQQPDPAQQEQIKQQAETERFQIEQRMEAMRHQAQMQQEMQLEKFRAMLDQQRSEREAEIEQMRQQQEFMFRRFEALLQASTEINKAQISAQATLTAQQDRAADEAASNG